MNKIELGIAVLSCANLAVANLCDTTVAESILAEGDEEVEREPVYLCDENGNHITDTDGNRIVTKMIKKQ